MTSNVKIVINSNLDSETLQEIQIMRELRLGYYLRIVEFPAKTLEKLSEIESEYQFSVDEIVRHAKAVISDLENRLKEPNLVYDDELSMYANTLEIPK